MDNKTNHLKILSSAKDYLPLLYILLVCISYTLLNSYYAQFDIDIKKYLSFQEIIYIFLPISNFIIILLVFQLLTYYYREILHLKKKTIIKEGKSNKSILRDTPDWIKKVVYYFLLFAFFQMLFNFSKIINKFDYAQLIIFFVVIVILFIILILKLYEILNEKNEKAVKPIFITLFLALFTGGIFTQRLEARFVLNGTPLYSLKLIRVTDTVKTNDNLVYIGETKNYYFLRNLKNKENVIIPNNSIRKTIKKKIVYPLKKQTK